MGLNTFGAGVRHTRTLKSHIEHVFCTIFPPLCISTTRQMIVLESCSNAQKMRQVFESAMKTNFFRFLFFCEWCHKWGRFLTILAQVTWPWANHRREVFCWSFY